MIAAVFMLAGVAAGALLGGAIQFLLQRRQEARSRCVAARLMIEELRWAQINVESALCGSTLDIRKLVASRSLSELWEAHRENLAGELDASAWMSVCHAVEQTRLRLQVKSDRNPERKSLELWLEFIERALSHLIAVADLAPSGRPGGSRRGNSIPST